MAARLLEEGAQCSKLQSIRAATEAPISRKKIRDSFLLDVDNKPTADEPKAATDAATDAAALCCY